MRLALKRTLALGAGVLSLVPLAQAAQEEGTPGSRRWGRDYFPNVPLTTHAGETVRFFDDLIEDKVVVINFIYTSCPDSCPLETARLAEVQSILGDRVGRDVFLYSISIDPARDTPEVLAEYRAQYGAGPGWVFLTGTEEDVTLLRKKLGLYIDEIQAEDTNDHNLSMVIGNQATGRWMRRSPFENPYVLANHIGDWLHNWQAPRDDGRDYADAPKLRDLEKGELIFRTRCTSCHVIGPGDGVPRVGPNLMGVFERRDRDWLARWIEAPDELLAQKDPTAWSLFVAWNMVPMPNMRLTEKDVEDVMEYMETESRRAEAVMGFDITPPEPLEEGEVEPCCQKDENIVLETEEDLDGTLALASSSKPSSGGLSRAGMFSVGLGVVLGLVSIGMRLRTARSRPA